MVIQGTCLGDVDWLNFQVIVLPVVLNNRQQSWFQSIHFGKQVSPSVTSQRSSIALWIWGSEGLLEKQEGMPWVSGAHRPPESIRCSDTTLWFHGLQHARLPCPSLSPGACLDSCPLSWWCYLTISTPVLLSSIFPSIKVFSNVLTLCIRCPKYWSFSISPSNEYSGLNSFRIDWFDLLAAQSTLESSPASQCKSINSSVLSLLYGPTLTSIHDFQKSHSLDQMDLCW